MRRSATSLRPEERLRSGAEIDRVFAQGRSAACRGMRLLYAGNSLTFNRVCVIPARGHRRAVDRNRTKRLGKEAFRATKATIVTGYDMVMICYPGDYSFAERMAQFRQLVGKAKLGVCSPDPS